MASGRDRTPAAYQWYQRNKTAVWTTAAAAATAYAVYRLVSSPVGDDQQQGPSTSGTDGQRGQQPARERLPPRTRFQQLKAAVSNYATVLSAVSDSAALVSSDLHAFLSSDCDEVPRSLRQLTKLLQSQEVQSTLQTAVSSVVAGASSAASSTLNASTGASNTHAGASAATPLVDTLLQALLSERGQGLVGMAVGIATRNATDAFCQFLERSMQTGASSGSSSSSFGLSEMLELLTSERGERLLSLLITKSIRTGVSTYVESTTGYNMYEDLLSSLAKDDHRVAVTEIMTRVTGAFCRELAVAYRKSRGGGPANAAPGVVVQQQQHAAGYAAGVDLQQQQLDSLSTGKAASAAPSMQADASAIVAAVTQSRCGMATAASGGSSGQQHSARALGGGKSQGANSLFSQQRLLLPSAPALPLPVPPAWLRQVVELAKERDVRTLTVDVVQSASRAAVRGAVEGFMTSATGQSSSGDGTASLSSSSFMSSSCSVLCVPSQLSAYKLYVMASLAVSLFMYSMSPRTLML